MANLTLFKNAVPVSVAAASLLLLVPARAATNSPPRVYPSDARAAAKIGNDLYQTLDARFQGKINPDAISTANADAPEIAPVRAEAGNKTPGQVLISTGFVDLINRLAHAKAIDRVQPGFFQQYAAGLARESAGENPAEAPGMNDPRYWSDDVMNDQVSYFNQMIGMTVAINLSHHYLGHCQKYASQTQTGGPAPLNSLISPSEWETSVKAATLNALDCAIGTEGARALFDAMDAMPRRPAWTGCIAPMNADLKKLNQELTQYETAYFHGGLKLDKSVAGLTGAPGGLAAK